MGSNPTSSTKYRDVIQWSEALVWDQGVVGSNPTIPTICPCDPTGKRAGFRDQILWVSPFGDAARTTPTGSTKHRRRKWWTRTPDKRVISRFDSCSVYQISGCGAVGARQFGELEVVGSIPTTQTIRVVKPFGHTRKAERICSRLLSGEIQVQPLGDPPNLTFG